MRPGGCGTRPMIDSAVTLLPQPDSPTMASVRPASTAKLTPSTARELAVVGAEEGAQVADLEQRAHRALGRGARAAWKRSMRALDLARGRSAPAGSCAARQAGDEGLEALAG